MNICFLEDPYTFLNPEGFLKSLLALGVTITAEPDENTQIIYNASVTRFKRVLDAKQKAPHAKIVNYCWDYYLWAHEGKHTLDWRGYAEMLKVCDAILVPSKGQQRRLKELLGLDSVVVVTGIDTYDHETSDERFVLDPVRYYEEDPQCYWVRDACKELNIPYLHSNHGFSQEEFRRLVSTCTIMTCGFVEASTGGLSLMEGLFNGKASLVSSSPYMGASDYIGPYGNYFTDYEDLKVKLDQLFNNPPVLNKDELRNYMKAYSFDAMALRILDVCTRLTN